MHAKTLLKLLEGKKVLYLTKWMGHMYGTYDYPKLVLYNDKILHVYDYWHDDKHIWVDINRWETYDVQKVDDKHFRLILYLDKYKFKMWGYFMLELK